LRGGEKAKSAQQSKEVETTMTKRFDEREREGKKTQTMIQKKRRDERELSLYRARECSGRGEEMSR